MSSYVHTTAPAWSRVQERMGIRTPHVMVFVAAHVPLALLMQGSVTIATVHALTTIALGLWWALFARRLRLVAATALYVAGAETLWRMNDASVFWETGKYALIAILGLSLLRTTRTPRRVWLPLLYFLLLVPSIILTVSALGFSAARDAISFNLSGPLALAVCLIFFSSISLRRREAQMVLWAAVGPTVGVATVALSSILSSGGIEFTQESNFTAAGGFGPNQVSDALGFGALLCLFLILRERRLHLRLIAFSLMIWFTIQALLTFSRGGVYNLMVAFVLVALHYLAVRRGRWVLLAAVVLLGLISASYVAPRLFTGTQGQLQARYEDFETTNRTALMQQEVRLWLENPLFGVGPGMSMYERAQLSETADITHTEFTRLLAEHGAAGLAALIVLLSIALASYRRAGTALDKAWVAGMAAWSLTAMVHSATRIAAIPLLLGLVAIRWREDSAEGRSHPSRATPTTRRELFPGGPSLSLGSGGDTRVQHVE